MTRAQKTTAADPEPSGAPVSPQRRNVVFLAIVLGMLLAALDQTIVATARPARRYPSMSTAFPPPSAACAIPMWSLSGAPPAAANSPEALHTLPHAMAAPIVHAYAASLTGVFMWAVPVALVGFTLSLFLREVPLREMGRNAADLGDGFAMPTTETSEEMLETAIGRLLRGEPGMRLRSIALRPDCPLDVAELWALLRINRFQRAVGVARITVIGDQLGIPYEVLEPTFDRLVAHGYAQRDVDRLWLTPTGARQVNLVSGLIRDWVVDKLARSPHFRGQADQARVAAAVDRIAHRIVAQPGWGEDRPTLSELATQKIPVGPRRPPPGVPSRHEPNRSIP